MLFSVAFGICPPQSSLRLRGARLHPALPQGQPARKRVVTAPAASSLNRPALSRLRGPGRNPSPSGPSDAFPSTLAQPALLPCGSFTDRPGLPHPARLASRICQPYFGSVRPWAPSLQRLLPTRRHPILSDRAVPHAVSHLAMSRLRGFELRVDAFSRASVVHAYNGSLLSWSFPPFEDDLPASPHTSAGLLSWASIMFPSPPIPARLPPRFVTSPSTRALFRVSENRKYGPVSPDPLRGVLADASIPLP